jgi:hypothetical protein
MNTSEIKEEARKSCKFPFINNETVDALIDRADYHHVKGTGTMVCSLVLKNRFTVTEIASCVDIRNFSEETAKKISYSKARDKVFQFVAFGFCSEHYGDN